MQENIPNFILALYHSNLIHNVYIDSLYQINCWALHYIKMKSKSWEHNIRDLQKNFCVLMMMMMFKVTFHIISSVVQSSYARNLLIVFLWKVRHVKLLRKLSRHEWRIHSNEHNLISPNYMNCIYHCCFLTEKLSL